MSKLITKNDLKAILDDVLPHDTIETITPSFTIDVSNPTGTVSSAQIIRIGHLCHLFMLVHNSTGSALGTGSNIFHARLTECRPLVRANGSGFYGNLAGIIQLYPDGEITVRLTGGNSTIPSSGASNVMYVSATYIV